MFSGSGIAGVDEVGRGALAGDVVSAAVILNPNWPIQHLKDSKVLTAKRRETLAAKIKHQALAWGIGHASPEEIERLNIHQASLLAMKRAVLALPYRPVQIWVDGIWGLELGIPCKTFIKGDTTIAAISAASILAKVTRDQTMRTLDQAFPAYGFKGNKGYGTASHLNALLKYGPCALHRKTFAPVHAALPCHING